MRHRNLVFAAFLATIIGFAAISAEGQGKPPEEGTPDLEGRVTDLAGRSIRNAKITVFSLSSDEVVQSKTNAFGFYRISGLTEGHSYILVLVEHPKYLFVITTIEFIAGEGTLRYDFLGEFLR